MLLTATCACWPAGAVMVYSASSARDLLSGAATAPATWCGTSLYGAVGLVRMHVLSRHGLEAVRRVTPLLLAARSGCCSPCCCPGIGVAVNGARRWIGAGPLQFQPSELLKLALVLYAAQLLGRRPERDAHAEGHGQPAAGRRRRGVRCSSPCSPTSARRW